MVYVDHKSELVLLIDSTNSTKTVIKRHRGARRVVKIPIRLFEESYRHVIGLNDKHVAKTWLNSLFKLNPKAKDILEGLL